MATIAEIREKYPQYSDLSDKQLADALHSKFYSDLPKEEFYSKIGLKVETKKAEDKKEESWFERVTRKSMTPSDSGGFVAGLAKGYTDPFEGIVQLAAKAGSALGVPGAEKVAADVTQRQQQYEQSREGQGFDVGRLVGGVTNPLFYTRAFTPAAAATAPMRTAAQTGGLAGATQPVVSDQDFWLSKAFQTGVGAAAGPALMGAADVVGTVGKAVGGLTERGLERGMQQFVQRAAGPNREEVIQALRNAPELVPGAKPTAAEALANVPSAAELVGAQAKLSRQEGLVGTFAQRTADQQAARVRAIQGIAGTPEERAALAATRDVVTGEMRETALAQADIAKTVLGEIDKQQNKKVSGIVAQWKSLLPPLQQTSPEMRVSTEELRKASASLADNLKKAQLDSLQQSGVFPVLASDITNSIDKALKGTTSDVSRDVLLAIKRTIESKADENGIIGSRDLYENVRKMSNQDIAKLLGLGEQYASGGIPQQAAKALGNVKKYIDNALDKSTDKLWSKYLKDYAAYSTKLNRMEVGAYLENKLQTPLEKEGAAAFAAAVENAATTIKRSTGIPRYKELSEILTTDQVKTVNSVVADLSRASKAQDIAKRLGSLNAGVEDAAGLLPPLIDTRVTVFKEALRFLQQGQQEKFNQRMTQLMMEPGQLAQFMSVGVPKNKLKQLTEAVYINLDESLKQAFVNTFTTIPLAQQVGE